MDQWSYAITFVDSAADDGCACGSGEGQQALHMRVNTRSERQDEARCG
jgi:hypothetical protein